MRAVMCLTTLGNARKVRTQMHSVGRTDIVTYLERTVQVHSCTPRKPAGEAGFVQGGPLQ